MKYPDLMVRYVAIVVVSVFAVGMLASGDSLKWEWLRFFAIATLVGSGGLLLWEHLLWRLPLPQRIPKVPRCVRGTWMGQLESHWVNPESGAGIEPKPCYLAMRQSASTLTATLFTNESKSRSTSAVLMHDGGEWTLGYMYLNKPGMKVEHRSRMHHGSTILDIVGMPVLRMQGRYWTDRDSKGELTFTEHRKKIADDYQSARGLFD